MSRVRYVNLSAQFEEERDEVMDAVARVLSSGILVGGEEVDALEQELADYIGVRHAVTLNSGTDALIFALTSAGIGPGDEVITPPNSFLASTGAIVRVGATPVFADVEKNELMDPACIEAAITPRTAAIMPVHLRGDVCRMDEINAIAAKHNLLVIEDAAQAMGSKLNDVYTGAFGGIGCFSAHPLKNFNAAGDAGFVTTNSAEVAEKVRITRNLGLKDRDTAIEFGRVSRMDAIQAAILRVRLRRLGSVIERRRANAALYRDLLSELPILVPEERNGVFHTYHNFVIKSDDRDALQAALKDAGVDALVHYGRPIHKQPAADGLVPDGESYPVTDWLAERILSLPINQFLTSEDVQHVAATIRTFYEGKPKSMASAG